MTPTAFHRELNLIEPIQGRSLYPEKPFLDDLYSVSLEAFRLLKAKWRVSIGMKINRLKNFEIIDEVAVQKPWMHYSRRGWRLRVPLDDDTPVEKPALIALAIEFLFSERLQNRKQFFQTAVLNVNDLSRLLGLAEEKKRAGNREPGTMRKKPIDFALPEAKEKLGTLQQWAKAPLLRVLAD